MLDFEGCGRFCKIFLGRFGLIITIYNLHPEHFWTAWNMELADS